MGNSIAPKTTTPYYAFGARLREARLQKGLSLRKLAAEIGLSHEYIHQVEKGYCKAMRPEHFPSLSALLSVPEAEWMALLDQTEYKTPKPFYTPAKKEPQ